MKFKLVEIKSKKTLNYKGQVHDLTVEDDHSYNINKIIVHNSICSTRIQTGFGVPTFQSILDCYSEKKNYQNVSIIADGGIRYPSDLVKSLAAGADAIMCGRIFAQTSDSPGVTNYKEGIAVKSYRGMASKDQQDKNGSGVKPLTCAEGVSTTIPVNGTVKSIIDEFSGGLRSAMTYGNAINLKELRDNSEFIKITPAGLSESHAFGTRKE